MIGVIKGDIISSRKLTDQEKWLIPLKDLLASWGNTLLSNTQDQVHSTKFVQL